MSQGLEFGLFLRIGRFPGIVSGLDLAVLLMPFPVANPLNLPKDLHFTVLASMRGMARNCEF